MIDICLLGTSGMFPLPDRWLSSVIMRHSGKSILFDCGEGTQITLRELGWSFKSIDYICFTHFHADHISGLPGLLLTMGNCDRTEPVTLIGPEGLQSIVEGLLVIAPQLPFQLNYIEIEYKNSIKIKAGDVCLTTFPLDHGMPCVGYTVTLNRQRKFSPEKAKENNIPVNLWGRLQKGEILEIDSKVFTPDMVLGETRQGLKVSFCTDTKAVDHIKDYIKDSDLLVCEGMYGEISEKNSDKFHMNIYEAAQLAKSGCVKELWLTHYSPSFTNPEEYQSRVQEIFPNTLMGYTRLTKTLKFSGQD